MMTPFCDASRRRKGATTPQSQFSMAHKGYVLSSLSFLGSIRRFTEISHGAGGLGVAQAAQLGKLFRIFIPGSNEGPKMKLN